MDTSQTETPDVAETDGEQGNHRWNCDFTLTPGQEDNECYCPMPGEEAISDICGHLVRSRCMGCGVCTMCDGCYCGED